MKKGMRGSKTVLKKQTKNAKKSYRKEAMSIDPKRQTRRREKRLGVPKYNW